MKKKTLMILGILIVILGVIGISYALWNKVLVQSGENIVNSDCFELVFEEGNGITLENSFPILDSEGKRLKPYHFKLQNVCNNEVDYQINLETTNNTTLNSSYIKVMINDLEPYLYSSKEETSVTISNGSSARILESGRLKEKETKEYDLRIWMDSRVTQNDEGAMNGVFESKITIQATYLKPTIASIIKNVPVVTEGNGLYEVRHEDADITYTEDTTAINNLKQTELRYAGVNPDNYVWFNNELWRIIGLVNTPEGQRVKIIRSESIGEYSWDSSESSINSGYGINEWSQSKIMNLLNNGPYYNRGSGSCYNGENNATIACDFSNSGLTDEAKEMIDIITWNIGSNDGVNYKYVNINTTSFYNLERSNNTGKICSSGTYCNDSVERTITWQGNIGLMYPSDYGYTTSGGNNMNRNMCLKTYLYEWNNYEECSKNSWLHIKDFQWTMIGAANTGRNDYSFYIYNNGLMSVGRAYSLLQIRPSLYLKINVNFVGGLGTQDNPYLLSL